MCHFVEQSSGQLDSLLLTRTSIVHEHCICIELGQFYFNMASLCCTRLSIYRTVKHFLHPCQPSVRLCPLCKLKVKVFLAGGHIMTHIVSFILAVADKRYSIRNGLLSMSELDIACSWFYGTNLAFAWLNRCKIDLIRLQWGIPVFEVCLTPFFL